MPREIEQGDDSWPESGHKALHGFAVVAEGGIQQLNNTEANPSQGRGDRTGIIYWIGERVALVVLAADHQCLLALEGEGLAPDLGFLQREGGLP